MEMIAAQVQQDWSFPCASVMGSTSTACLGRQMDALKLIVEMVSAKVAIFHFFPWASE